MQAKESQKGGGPFEGPVADAIGPPIGVMNPPAGVMGGMRAPAGMGGPMPGGPGMRFPGEFERMRSPSGGGGAVSGKCVSPRTDRSARDTRPCRSLDACTPASLAARVYARAHPCRSLDVCAPALPARPRSFISHLQENTWETAGGGSGGGAATPFRSRRPRRP